MNDEIRKRLIDRIDQLLHLLGGATGELEKSARKNKIAETLEYIRSLLEELERSLEHYLQMSSGINSSIENKLVEITEKLASYREQLHNFAVEFGGTVGANVVKKYKSFANELNSIIDTTRNYISQLKNRENYKLYARIRDMLNQIEDEFYGIEKNLDFFVNGDTSMISDPELVMISTIISELQTRGLMCSDLLDYISGIRAFEERGISREIDVNAGEGKSLTLDALFYRYPPFEPFVDSPPVEIKSGEGINVPGRLVWFEECRNLTIDIIRVDNKNERPLSIDDLRKARDMGSSLQLLRVTPLDTVEYYAIVEGKINDDPIFIKYGSPALKKRIDELKKKIGSLRNREKIRKQINEWERELSGNGRKYSFLDLFYVWQCELGYGLSTDPFDRECPFIGRCPMGKNFAHGRKCRLWRYSRRRFPRVFGIREIKTIKKDLDYLLPSFSIVTPVKGKNLSLKKRYTGIHFNVSGRSISLKFKKPIEEIIEHTNVIGFVIPEEILNEFIHAIFFNKGKKFILHFPGKNILVSYHDLILTRLYLEESMDNFYTALKGEFRKNFLHFKKEFLKKTEEKQFQEIQSITAENILHTLAHLLMAYISTELDIEERDLLYLVGSSINEKHEYYVLIAENSNYGILDIIKAAEEKFGSVEELIRSFFKNVADMLNTHEREIKDYVQQAVKHRNLLSQKNKLPQENQNAGAFITKTYLEMISEGLVLDYSTFYLYILNSKQFRNKLLKNVKNLEWNKFRDNLHDLLAMYGPSFCVDGCVNCVMFQRGCTKPLHQHMYLSRNLAKEFVDVLLGNTPIRGPGHIGEAILKNLSTERIVCAAPFIDEWLAKILIKIAKRGVTARLLCRKEKLDELSDQVIREMRGAGIEIYETTKERHDKVYLIDSRIHIESSWNPLTTENKESYTIKMIDPEKARIIEAELFEGAIKYER